MVTKNGVYNTYIRLHLQSSLSKDNLYELIDRDLYALDGDQLLNGSSAPSANEASRRGGGSPSVGNALGDEVPDASATKVIPDGETIPITADYVRVVIVGSGRIKTNVEEDASD